MVHAAARDVGLVKFRFSALRALNLNLTNPTSLKLLEKNFFFVHF